MSPSPAFTDFIRRIRAGDSDAAFELVRQYEPYVRRVIRFRLFDSRLAAAFDSMDVCQSVLGSFFIRAAAGQYDLETPDQLVKLLAGMARNKLAAQTRRERAQCRDRRRVTAGELEAMHVKDPSRSPSAKLAAQELMQEVRRRLSAEELQLLELRARGDEWADIAAQVGSTPTALRQRFCRALNRVTRELGLEDSGNE